MKTSKRRAFRQGAPWPPLLLFSIFFFIAAGTVVVLEYNDYRQGRHSLIFNDMLGMGSQQEDEFQKQLVGLLQKYQLAYDCITDRSGARHFKISLPENQLLNLTSELARLVDQHQGQLELSEAQNEENQTMDLYQIRFKRRVSHVLLLTRVRLQPETEMKFTPETKAAKPKATGTPRLAIIIDDIGYNSTISDILKDLHVPLTAAVLPDAPFAASESQKLYRYGLEEIIHLPMRSKNSTNHYPRDRLLSSESSDEEIDRLIREAKAITPYARGVNNHMGSLLTSQKDAIQRVLLALKKANLFFIDSRTSGDSLAYETAKELHIKTLFRDVFLDDRQSYFHTINQLRQLVAIAQRNGKALGIGHPFETTLSALRDTLPWIKNQNVTLVFASALLE